MNIDTSDANVIRCLFIITAVYMAGHDHVI